MLRIKNIMNRILKAIGLVGVVGLALNCGDSKVTSCIDCQQLTCNQNQLDTWCLVDITDVSAGCHFEHSVGECLTVPKAGLPKTVTVSNWIWSIMPTLVQGLVGSTYGTKVGFELVDCRIAASNPWFGKFNTNSISVNAVLTKVSLPTASIKVEDETACEDCAAGSCNLPVCGGDSNCSCWVGCAFNDATLASCPGICGPQGGVTQALVNCLVTSCGEACGVPGMATTCSPTTSNGTGGSPNTSCQAGGDDCSADTDCCSGNCIGASGGLMGTCA